MAHVSLNDLETQVGYRAPNTTLPDLEKAFRELQGYTETAVVGVASGSAVSLSGISTQDTIIGCIGLTAGNTFVNAAASVTLSGNNIQIDTNNVTGLSVLVKWLDKDGFQGLP